MIRVQFSDRFSDYIEFNWVNSANTRFWVTLSRFVFFLPIPIFLWLKVPLESWIDSFLDHCTIGVGIAAFGGKYYQAWQRWRIRPSNEDETVCEFNETGMRAITANTDVTISWSDISKYRETGKLFLLRMPNGYFTFIPKRAFTDQEEQQAFRALLQQNIHDQPSTSATLPTNSLQDTVTIPFKLNVTDYLEMYDVVVTKKMRWVSIASKILFACYVLYRISHLSQLSLVYAAADALDDPLRKWFSLFLYSLVDFVIVIPLTYIGFNKYFYAWVNYRKQPAFQQVELSDAGLHLQAGSILNWLKWEYLSQFTKTQNLFLFRTQSKGIFAIPKRAVPDETKQQFEAMLSQKITQVA